MQLPFAQFSTTVTKWTCRTNTPDAIVPHAVLTDYGVSLGRVSDVDARSSLPVAELCLIHPPIPSNRAMPVAGVVSGADVAHPQVRWDRRCRSSTVRPAGGIEAGIYVGDSPEAHAVVSENRVWDDGIGGLFVRHVHFATVVENWAKGNCIGIFLLNDGQPEEGRAEGRRERRIARQQGLPGSEERASRRLSGGGIVLSVPVDNVVRRDLVDGNHGDTLVSGGIVLISSPFGDEPRGIKRQRDCPQPRQAQQYPAPIL